MNLLFHLLPEVRGAVGVGSPAMLGLEYVNLLLQALHSLLRPLALLLALLHLRSCLLQLSGNLGRTNGIRWTQAVTCVC